MAQGVAAQNNKDIKDKYTKKIKLSEIFLGISGKFRNFCLQFFSPIITEVII